MVKWLLLATSHFHILSIWWSGGSAIFCNFLIKTLCFSINNRYYIQQPFTIDEGITGWNSMGSVMQWVLNFTELSLGQVRYLKWQNLRLRFAKMSRGFSYVMPIETDELPCQMFLCWCSLLQPCQIILGKGKKIENQDDDIHWVKPISEKPITSFCSNSFHSLSMWAVRGPAVRWLSDITHHLIHCISRW